MVNHIIKKCFESTTLNTFGMPITYYIYPYKTRGHICPDISSLSFEGYHACWDEILESLILALGTQWSSTIPPATRHHSHLFIPN